MNMNLINLEILYKLIIKNLIEIFQKKRNTIIG